ncbi:MAG: molybdopterin-dependent oxidoreductase [Desulfuromonadaceae bacterium]
MVGADGLKAAKNDKGLGILAGGRLSNEELFLVKQLAKEIGTENIDHSGGECYKGVTEGLAETLGVQASTGTFPQIEACDAILAIRSDFYETHPVVGMVVNQAIRANHAELMVIGDKKGKLDKLPGAETLLHAPGMEVNVLNAIAQVLIEENLAVTDGVAGLDELKKQLSKYGADKVAKDTGVSEEAIRSTARKLAAAKKTAILLAYGLPYTANSKELGLAAANLAILCGNAGQEGCGLYLCGEKANSQGAIDLGILPGKGGLGAQAMLEALAGGKLSGLYILGEDPVSSYPNRAGVEAALEKASFVVVQDLFLSPTAQQADVVLPACSFAEKDGTFTNGERRIQRLRAGIKSPGEAKTDRVILEKLLASLGAQVSYTGPAAIFSAIAGQVAGYAGINFDEIGPQGTVWGGENLSLPKKQLVAVGGAKAIKGKHLLLTGSALYHSGTLSTHAKGPLAVVAESYIELGREDAQALKVAEGDLVTVKAANGELKVKAKVGNRLPKGVVFVPYHFEQAGVNRIYQGEAAIAVELKK